MLVPRTGQEQGKAVSTKVLLEGHLTTSLKVQVSAVVVTVPIQFDVLQVRCMSDDISILLYQFRISGKLLLAEKMPKDHLRNGRGQAGQLVGCPIHPALGIGINVDENETFDCVRVGQSIS